MNFKKNFTPAKAAKKDIKKPTKSAPVSWQEKLNPVFIKSYPVAAIIVGTASRKENSTIARRESFKDRPPIIVAAARETPGTIATDWHKPIKKAFL